MLMSEGQIVYHVRSRSPAKASWLRATDRLPRALSCQLAWGKADLVWARSLPRALSFHIRMLMAEGQIVYHVRSPEVPLMKCVLVFRCKEQRWCMPGTYCCVQSCLDKPATFARTEFDRIIQGTGLSSTV